MCSICIDIFENNDKNLKNKYRLLVCVISYNLLELLGRERAVGGINTITKYIHVRQMIFYLDLLR